MEIPQGWLSKIISRANRAIYFFSNIFKEEDNSCVEYHSHQLLTLLSLVQSDEVTSNRETARRCILVLRQSFKLSILLKSKISLWIHPSTCFICFCFICICSSQWPSSPFLCHASSSQVFWSGTILCCLEDPGSLIGPLSYFYKLYIWKHTNMNVSTGKERTQQANHFYLSIVQLLQLQ